MANPSLMEIVLVKITVQLQACAVLMLVTGILEIPGTETSIAEICMSSYHE
jgi:hypothetical protein